MKRRTNPPTGYVILFPHLGCYPAIQWYYYGKAHKPVRDRRNAKRFATRDAAVARLRTVRSMMRHSARVRGSWDGIRLASILPAGDAPPRANSSVATGEASPANNPVGALGGLWGTSV